VKTRFAKLIVCLVLSVSYVFSERILLEAESMLDQDGRELYEIYQGRRMPAPVPPGDDGRNEYDRNERGWYINQQMMDVYGSSYILAHGMGTPVPDVHGEIVVSEGGNYQVFVLTRDWAIPEGSGAGIFEVHIDGEPLDSVFGNAGVEEWVWQDGGSVGLSPGTSTLSLHDLTGWEGRCDAVFLTNEEGYFPPVDFDELMTLRRSLINTETAIEVGDFDMVVIGGGISGCCAALSASYAGLKVALINDRPHFGGNNLMGVPVGAPEDEYLFPRNMDYTHRYHERIHEYRSYKDENGNRVPYTHPEDLKLYPNIHVMEVDMKDAQTISAVVGTHTATNKRYRFRAPLFVDATGDGTVGFHAGAEYRMGRESKAQTGEPDAPDAPDSQHLPFSVYWDRVDESTPQPWPDLPWFHKPISCNGVPKANYSNREGHFVHPFKGRELIRDHMFQKQFGAWAWAKHDPEMGPQLVNTRMEYTTHLTLPRESRRIIGDYVYSELDIIEKRAFPDGVVIAGYWLDAFQKPNRDKTLNCNWEEGTGYAKATASAYQDLLASEGLAKVAFLYDYPTEIPYRCYYSKDIDNLFLGGRNISCTHIAHGKLRIQGTTAMAGTMVGRAGYLCRSKESSPREIYENHFDELTTILDNPDNLPPVEHWSSGVPPTNASLARYKRVQTEDSNRMNEVYSVTGRLIGRLDAKALNAVRTTSGRGHGIYLVKNAKGKALMKHFR